MAIRNPNENESIKEYDELQSGYVNDLEDRIDILEPRVDTIADEIDNLTAEVNKVQNAEIQELSPINGWTTSTTWQPLRATKINGVVHIQGFITGGGLNATAVTQLLGAMRPLKPSRFAVASSGGTSLVQVNDNGTIVVMSGSTTNIFLDGISYVAR